MIHLAENNLCEGQDAEKAEVRLERAWFGECSESNLPTLMGNNNGEGETVISESIHTACLKIPPVLWLWLQECFVGHRRKALVVALNKPYSNFTFHEIPWTSEKENFHPCACQAAEGGQMDSGYFKQVIAI